MTTSDDAEAPKTAAEQLLQQAVEAALEITDPIDRARAITGLLEAVQKASVTLKRARQQDVLTLKEGRTFKEVGELIGVGAARADQIAKGR